MKVIMDPTTSLPCFVLYILYPFIDDVSSLFLFPVLQCVSTPLFHSATPLLFPASQPPAQSPDRSLLALRNVLPRDELSLSLWPLVSISPSTDSHFPFQPREGHTLLHALATDDHQETTARQHTHSLLPHRTA